MANDAGKLISLYDSYQHENGNGSVGVMTFIWLGVATPKAMLLNTSDLWAFHLHCHGRNNHNGHIVISLCG